MEILWVSGVRGVFENDCGVWLRFEMWDLGFRNWEWGNGIWVEREIQYRVEKVRGLEKYEFEV